MKRILLTLDPAEGGAPSETPTPPATPPAAAPIAAAVVAAGARSEREITLDSELTDERKRHATTTGEKTARENRINELEDELRGHRTRTPKKTDDRSTLEKWFAGEEV
jgi:hypothetical protein